MAFSKDTLRDIYRKRAGRYDFTANLYYLIGFRETHYRREAIARLALQPGDAVVEIGCGTGLNFPYILEYIGDSGRLVGVDLTDAMLAEAASRIRENGWHNVELQQADAAEYEFPREVNGVFSSFALTLVPEYELVIERARDALTAGGRFVLLDLKKPNRWPLWVTKLAVAASRPFGVTLDLAGRRPWQVMQSFFSRVSVQEVFGGFAYIAVGER